MRKCNGIIVIIKKMWKWKYNIMKNKISIGWEKFREIDYIIKIASKILLLQFLLINQKHSHVPKLI